jgi:hypothetical protein
MKSPNKLPNHDWGNATWEGSRRAMLRSSLRLTVRERLQRMIELNRTSAALAKCKKSKPDD